jgi:hypothetical protein
LRLRIAPVDFYTFIVDVIPTLRSRVWFSSAAPCSREDVFHPTSFVGENPTPPSGKASVDYMRKPC